MHAEQMCAVTALDWLLTRSIPAMEKPMGYATWVLLCSIAMSAAVERKDVAWLHQEAQSQHACKLTSSKQFAKTRCHKLVSACGDGVLRPAHLCLQALTPAAPAAAHPAPSPVNPTKAPASTNKAQASTKLATTKKAEAAAKPASRKPQTATEQVVAPPTLAAGGAGAPLPRPAITVSALVTSKPGGSSTCSCRAAVCRCFPGACCSSWV